MVLAPVCLLTGQWCKGSRGGIEQRTPVQNSSWAGMWWDERGIEGFSSSSWDEAGMDPALEEGFLPWLWTPNKHSSLAVGQLHCVTGWDFRAHRTLRFIRVFLILGLFIPGNFSTSTTFYCLWLLELFVILAPWPGINPFWSDLLHLCALGFWLACSPLVCKEPSSSMTFCHTSFSVSDILLYLNWMNQINQRDYSCQTEFLCAPVSEHDVYWKTSCKYLGCPAMF